MKSKKKVFVTVLCAVLLVVASVLGTMAYLTSEDTATNTFTVGKVAITLDEADVDENGVLLKDEDGKALPRVKENDYKLMPGHTYIKDPTVTVVEDSEASYVKMTVTFTRASQLDAIFDPGAVLTSIFNGYDGATWLYKGNTENTADNTRTYEFWYKEPVAAPTADVELDALFDSITVPGTITNAQLDTIQGMTITVNAYAIQADGFTNAEAAWAAYK